MRVLSILLLLALSTALASAGRHAKRAASSTTASAAAPKPWSSVDVAAAAPAPNVTALPFNVWPAPQRFRWNKAAAAVLAYPLTFTYTAAFPDLDAAVARFTARTFPHRPSGDPGSNTITQVHIEVADIDAPLQLSTDESYELDVPRSGQVVIYAATYYGALHALETLSQLVTFDFTRSYYRIASGSGTIQDAPRYPHRGILVDTSRHYQTLPIIRTIIDSMTYAKYNVFHWHLSDIQSFPYQSDVLPRLAYAAYSQTDRYSTGDVADVVEYARQRGVRVMIEFDIPGHAGSWCVGYPEVCPSPTCNMPLDPSSNATFALMEKLFTEVTGAVARHGLVPEDLFHLGGDEVDLSCWTQVAHVKRWLAANNLTDRDAYRYMVERAHDIVYRYGRTPVNWDEVYANFGTTIDPQTIIHVWRDETYVQNATRDGFRVLVSPDGPWYLDGLDTLWSDMYLLEPQAGITDARQAARILGGEACMWGETADASDIVQTIWPRAAAIAERLWSPRQYNDVAVAEPRYAYFRCLLNRRGIAAAPYNNTEARTAPDGPGSCLSQ